MNKGAYNYLLYSNTGLFGRNKIKEIIKQRDELYKKNGINWNTQLTDEYRIRKLIELDVIAILTVYDSEGLVAISEMTKADKNMRIMRLLVDKDNRKQGIATEMLKIWKDKFMNDKEAIRLWLSTSNEEAKRVYKKIGFEEIGQCAMVIEK